MNATLNTPGVYASCFLNPSLSNPGSTFDKAISAQGNTTPVAISITPALPGEYALFAATLFSSGALGTLKPPGWTGLFDNGTTGLFSNVLPTAATVNISRTITNQDWTACIALFGATGTPTVLQSISYPAIYNAGGVGLTAAFGSNVSTGTMLVMVYTNQGSFFNRPPVITGDSRGNTWQTAAGATQGSVGNAVQTFIMFAPSGSAGANTITMNLPASNNGTLVYLFEVSGLVPLTSFPYSQILKCLNFPFSIPLNVGILGFEVELTGNQTNLAPDSFLTVSLINPSASSLTFTCQLPTVDGTVVVGSPLQNWGLTLTPALFNNPNFGFQVFAQSTVTNGVGFNISAAKLKVFLTPNPPPSINYLKSFAETSGDVLNLFLGSDGIMYQETLLTAPSALTAVYTAIQPNSFAQSCTQSDREFIAISNLLNGTDVPYSYNGVNFDRCSQVGPGAAPALASTSSGNAIVSITQEAAVTFPTGSHDFITLGPGPVHLGSPSTPGNVVTIQPRTSFVRPPGIVAGSNIVITGAPLLNGFNINNDPTGATNPPFWTVTSIGPVISSNQTSDWVSFQVPFTGFFSINNITGVQIEGTLATLTTATQVPNLEVGNQFTIAGTGGSPPAGYDGSYTVTATPNASQMQITSVSRLANVATYGFTLVSGTTPTVGEFVTVTQTLSGNGSFNVSNVQITSASPGTFSINLPGPNQASAAENGSGIVFGTIFQFDPLRIVGNKSGGTIQTSGTIAAGTRKCCYSFLTRNGYITQPSPILTFSIPSGGSSLIVSNLLTGPSNVVARIIHLTAADGSNFYNLPQPVSVISNGVTVVNSSTWVLDNTSTSVKLSFSDGVLLTGLQIDKQGNNLFETAELGSSVGFIPYAQRIFAIGEQDKVTNFLNWSFDGGIISGVPAGWTVDPTNGGGGSVISSPIFGFAYSITNSTGVTQATYGMISQDAFQDEFMVPIIQASTTYSARITAAVPTGATTGQLVVDLFSASIGQSLGTFTTQLSTLASTMNIFTGTMLTTTLAPVPKDLVLRLYAKNILTGVTITIDRVEVFPTQEPNLNTQVTGSYIANFEAFDQITGVISGSVQNQQPIRSAFVLFDVLYLVKNKSFVAIRNVDGLEPVFWGVPRVVSNSVGTPSIYGVTSGIDTPNSGEEWAIIAGEAGAYIFNGGEPIKLSEEIQSLWNQINWTYGHTIWVQNDIVNRRILFGVPLKTPNTWLPTGIIPDNANPTTPNVVLDLSYKQLPSASHLANAPLVRPTYRGDLIASDYTRKWSVWTMSVPASAFILRQDTTSQLLLGNSSSNGKIYQLIPGRLDDDGAAIDEKYFTYAFLSAEQENAKQIGPIRKDYKMMLALLDGAGSVAITAFPNKLTTAYPTPLLPNISLPIASDGDVEIPINVTANRCFFGFESNSVGSGFSIARLSIALTPDPWSPVRGIN